MSRTTNEEHYLSGVAIMGHYNELQRIAGTGQLSMWQAQNLAKAKAWDAYCKTKQFSMIRGMPGGILPLNTLKSISRSFEAWLKEEYISTL